MKRPTRRDLLLVIGELQTIIGAMHGAYRNDRARDTADQIHDLAERGMALAVKATSFDPPQEGRWPRDNAPGQHPDPDRR